MSSLDTKLVHPNDRPTSPNSLDELHVRKCWWMQSATDNVHCNTEVWSVPGQKPQNHHNVFNNLWKQLVCRRVCPSPRLPISKSFGHFWIWCNQFSFSLQNSHVSPGPRIVDHVTATFFVLNVMVSFHRLFSSAHVDIVLVSFISQFRGVILVHG